MSNRNFEFDIDENLSKIRWILLKIPPISGGKLDCYAQYFAQVSIVTFHGTAACLDSTVIAHETAAMSVGVINAHGKASWLFRITLIVIAQRKAVWSLGIILAHGTAV